MKTLLALLISASSLLATQVTDTFIDRVAFIESRNGLVATDGDSGRAIGVFQFWSIAWEQTSIVRAKAGEKTYPYFYARDPEVSRTYARSYLLYLERTLERTLHRQPSQAEIYAAWNMGVGRFKQVGYDLSKVPATTKRAIAKL